MDRVIPVPRPNLRQSKFAAQAAGKYIFFVTALFMGGFIAYGINNAQTSLENFLYAQISEPLDKITIITPPRKVMPEIDLDAKAALSIKTGANGREKIIYKNNEKMTLPIASLTKLMTAAVVYEHPEIYAMDRQVAIDEKIAEQENVPLFGNLENGQVATVEELVNKMIFYSSNDAAFALAQVMGVDEFVVEMNKKAQKLALENTEFYNPTGLDIAGGLFNKSSAWDIKILLEYIINNHPEIFATGLKPGPYLTENGIFDLNFWDGQVLVGGKTGYTDLAGGCMAVVLQDIDKNRYIHIILGSASSETRVSEMQKLINVANNTTLR